MKRLYTSLAIAGMLFATACSNDSESFTSNDNGVVTFSVTTPNFGSRTIGDGLSATTLKYAVYDENWNHLPLLDGSKTFSYETDVTMSLINGKTYNFIFWAQNDAAPYTFDAEGKKMTVNYDGIKGNNENLDAFYKVVEAVEVKNGMGAQEVIMTRPFAQLNIATSDWDKFTASAETFTQTEVKVFAYETLDFVSGEVSDGAVRTFNYANIPAETFALDNNPTQFKWLAMNYLLVYDKELVDVTFNANNANVSEKTYTNVPLERNFKTNITGKLLTTSVDFDITVDEDFNKPDQKPENSKTVATTAELQSAIAAATEPIVIEMEAGTYTFDKIDIPSNKTVYLQQAEATSRATTATGITIDGQLFVTGELYIDGATINNANATSEGISKSKDNAIYVQSEGKVVVTNSTFNISKATGITSWWSTGEAQTNVIVKNCVFNCNGNRPLQIEANATIENCTFNDPYRYVAQLTSSNAVINFKNNKITQSKTSGKATYGLQLTSDYGNSNLVINGEGNVIEGRGKDDALYVWELGTGISNGFVDIATITLNATDGQFYVLDGDTFAIAINTVEDLQNLAAEVNGGNTYAGKNIVLLNDLDLGNNEWTPIGNSTYSFQGNFNGLNHVIKNLNITTDRKSNIGLFGFTTNGKIENLTVENAQIAGRLNVGVVAGNPYTTKYENITVKGLIQVEGMSYVGGVGGKNAYTNWTNITVNATPGSYVKANSVENGIAYRTYVGGVIGFMGEGSHSFTNVTSNIDVYGTTCDIGGITGIAHYGNSFINCKSSGNVTITEAAEVADAEEIGGIAGVWYNQAGQKVTFTNCEYTGTLSANIEGVNLKDNTIVGASYNKTGAGAGELWIDGVVKALVSSTEQLNTVLASAQNGSTIMLSEGTYVIPDEAQGKTLSIVGTGDPEDTKIATNNTTGSYEGCNYAFDGSTVVFENISINTPSTTYIGYARCKATYNNCIINGTFTLYDNSVFNNCTFNVSGDVYNIWTWGAPTAEFNNCTFNSDGKAMLLYGQADTKLTINNCTFNDNGGLTDLKAAIEIGNDYNKSYELIVNKTTVNGYEINDKGIVTGTTLWANKNSMGKENLNVVVDGVDVY